MFALFQGNMASWSLTDIIIFIIIVAACVGIMFVALRQFGVAIPPIVVCAFFAIFAIRLIAGM